MLYQMIFSGFRKSKTRPIDVGELKHKCDVFERFNITGVSLFSDGVFLSVLEGSQAEVKAIFESVTQDDRLSQVQLIVEHAIQTREFDEFRIGFSHMDYSDIIPQAFKLDVASYKNSLPETPSSELAIFASTFAKVNALYA